MSDALHILCLGLGANNSVLDIHGRFMPPLLHLFMSTSMLGIRADQIRSDAVHCFASTSSWVILIAVNSIDVIFQIQWKVNWIFENY